MGRQQFTSRNNIGQVLTFQKSGATSSFDPIIGFSSGLRRVSWKLDNGSNITQTAGNFITYTGFTSDSGIRTIQMKGNSFNDINSFDISNDNLYGNLDLTPISELGGGFRVDSNINLTGITHSSSSKSFNLYYANNCNLTGNLDLTPLSGLGGNFQLQNNPNLTGITHPQSSQNFIGYTIYACNLTGNLDLTSLSGLGGSFSVYNNSGLTSITHFPSNNKFTNYNVQNCNLTGNLDLTPLSGLGGNFNVNNNPLLTGITHSQSSENFTAYLVNNCNIIGNLDLTPLTKLGGPNSGSTGYFQISSNTNLTGVTFPIVNTFFKNAGNNVALAAFRMPFCNLDYVDFKPLSGTTLLSGSTQGIPRIQLENNNMSSADVNHILVDFSGNTTYNPTGWSNVRLDISGTNAAPDSSSGGYDGIAARNFLTGSPYNWIITHS